jgi:hypothetical protein
MLRSLQKTHGRAILLGLFFLSEYGLSSELEESEPPQKFENQQIQDAVETIAHHYLINVKPLFKQACFDCHTNLTRYPWYYNMPVIKKKIDKDIAEAREHLDFSNDYPFMSKSRLTEDLEKIAENLEDKSMPPLPYAVVHRTKSLSSEQKKKIFSWIDDSLKLLTNAGYLASNTNP